MCAMVVAFAGSLGQILGFGADKPHCPPSWAPFPAAGPWSTGSKGKVEKCKSKMDSSGDACSRRVSCASFFEKRVARREAPLRGIQLGWCCVSCFLHYTGQWLMCHASDWGRLPFDVVVARQ